MKLLYVKLLYVKLLYVKLLYVKMLYVKLLYINLLSSKTAASTSADTISSSNSKQPLPPIESQKTQGKLIRDDFQRRIQTTQHEHASHNSQSSAH